MKNHNYFSTKYNRLQNALLAITSKYIHTYVDTYICKSNELRNHLLYLLRPRYICTYILCFVVFVIVDMRIFSNNAKVR